MVAGPFVDVSQQPACRFAIETNCRNQRVVFLDTARPGFRVEFNTVIPLFHGRTKSQIAPFPLKFGHWSSPLTTRTGFPMSRGLLRDVGNSECQSLMLNCDALTVRHALPSHDETPLKDQ